MNTNVLATAEKLEAGVHHTAHRRGQRLKLIRLQVVEDDRLNIVSFDGGKITPAGKLTVSSHETRSSRAAFSDFLVPYANFI